MKTWIVQVTKQIEVISELGHERCKKFKFLGHSVGHPKQSKLVIKIVGFIRRASVSLTL